jgi:O-antigen ligase
MKPFTPGEFVLTAWVASLYAFSADSSRVWISSVAAVLMLGIAALESIRTSSMPLNAVVLSRIAFVGYCAVTVVGESATGVSVVTIILIAQTMAAAAAVSLAARSIRAVELGCYAGAAVLLINAFMDIGFSSPAARYGNLLGNPNSYAFAIIMAALFAVRRLLLMGLHPGRRFARAALSLLIVASAQQIVVASGSQKGMLCATAAAAFAIAGTWLIRGRKRALRLTIAMVLAGAAIMAYGGKLPNISRLNSVVEFFSGAKIKDPSAVTRASMGREAWDMWRQKPIFGWGFDQFRLRTARGSYAHSNVLELLANGGLAAVSLYYIGFVLLAADIARRWRRTHVRESRLDLAWTALVLLVLFSWGLAAVQYDQKLDAVILAAISVMPVLIGRKAVFTAAPRGAYLFAGPYQRAIRNSL